MDVESVTSGLIRCLRMNVTDPQSRASGSYWIDSSWIDERLAENAWPQISMFEVGSRSEETKDERYLAYFSTYQVDVFASSSKQKNDISDDIKKQLLLNRGTLKTSGINIDEFGTAMDSIEDERMPLKTFRKTFMYNVYFYGSG